MNLAIPYKNTNSLAPTKDAYPFGNFSPHVRDLIVRYWRRDVWIDGRKNFVEREVDCLTVITASGPRAIAVSRLLNDL